MIFEPSVLFYLSLFGLLLCVLLGAQVVRQRSPAAALWLAVLVLAVLCFVSTVREPTVGFDYVGTYGRYHFNQALRAGSLSEYWRRAGGMEYTYAMLLYVITRLSSDECIYFFTFTLLTMGSLLWASWRLNGGVWGLHFALMLIVVYVNSFCTIRQMLAVGLLTLTYTFWRGRRGGWRFWLSAFVTFGAHGSAIAGLLMVVFVCVVRRWPERRQLRWIVLLALGCVVAFFCLALVVRLLGVGGYARYISSSMEEVGAHASWDKKATLCYFFFGCLAYYCWRHRLYDERERFAFAAFVVLAFFGMMLKTISSPAGRIEYYFSPLALFYALQALRRCELRVPVWSCRVLLVVLAGYIFYRASYEIPVVGLEYASSTLGLDYTHWFRHLFR